MYLNNYLRRINFTQPVNPDRATLAKLMQAHLLAVPFENLDVQLGVPVSTKIHDIYDKIVERNRGGWCFEVNALFKWALTEIGFDVQSLAGHVGRVETEPPRKSGHLFLRVDCDEPLFVDVGYGGSQFAPMPLSPCTVEQSPYTLSITPANNGFYRWTEQAHDISSTLDFTLDPVGPDYFDDTNRWLQTSQESPFTRTLTAQRRYADRHVVLRGLVKKTISSEGVSEVTLRSSEELVACLLEDFGLDVPEVAQCWDKVWARHNDMQNAQS